MLKQDFPWTIVRPNSFEMLPEFCGCPDIGVRVDCLPSQHCTHKNYSFTVPEDSDHYLACWQTVWIFLFCGNWRWCHSMDCLFVSSSIWWTQVASALTVWVGSLSPLALKHSNNWKKWPSLGFMLDHEAESISLTLSWQQGILSQHFITYRWLTPLWDAAAVVLSVCNPYNFIHIC